MTVAFLPLTHTREACTLRVGDHSPSWHTKNAKEHANFRELRKNFSTLAQSSSQRSERFLKIFWTTTLLPYWGGVTFHRRGVAPEAPARNRRHTAYRCDLGPLFEECLEACFPQPPRLVWAPVPLSTPPSMC